MAANKEILIIEIREDGARVVKRSINDIGKTADATQDSVKQLKGLLGGLVTSKVLKDTIMLGDAYANLMNRLRVVTSSNFELNAAMEGVFDMTVKTRTSLEANVDMYARVALNTKQMGLAMQDVLEFSTALNHAIILSGVTAREAQWGMVQFSQALAAGALRGDELRAVMEQLPVVTKVIAKHMGVTRGELRLLAFQGRVTSRVMVEAFSGEAAEELARLFQMRIPTIDQGLTTLRSSLIRFIGEQDQAVQGTSTLAQGLLLVARNMDILGRLAEIAGVIIGSVLLTNLMSVLKGMKLFSLSVLKANKSLLAFGIAATTIAVFADKIKVSNIGMATLSDIMVQFGSQVKIAADEALVFAANMVTASEVEFTEPMTTIQELTMSIARFSDRFVGVFKGLWSVIKNGVSVIGTHIQKIIFKISAFFTAVSDTFKAQIEGMKTRILALGSALKQALRGNFKGAKAIFEEGQGQDPIEKLMANYKSRISGVDELFKTSGKTSSQAFWEGFWGTSKASASFFDRLFKGGTARARARSEGEIAKGTGGEALTPTQSTLRKSIQGNLDNTFSKLKDLEVLMDNQEITYQQYTRTYVELQSKLLESSTSTTDGFKKGFMEVGLEITNFAEMSSQVVTNAFSSMEDALVSFVTTGKVDFKSLVDGMLADLTRLLARQMLVKAIGGLAGGPIGQFASAAFSSGGGGAAPGRAAGGPMSAGGAFRIMEHNKPELLVMGNQGGRMVSDQQLASAPAEQQPIIVYNVWSTDDVIDVMNGPKGERVIINKSPGRQGQR